MHTTLLLLAVSGLVTSTLYFRWSWIQQRAAAETSQITAHTLNAPEVLEGADRLSKALISTLLSDQGLKQRVTAWGLEVLSQDSVKENLQALVLDLFKQEAVLSGLTVLGKEWIDNLVELDSVKASLGRLVVDVLLQEEVINQSSEVTRKVIELDNVKTATGESLREIIGSSESLEVVQTLGRQATARILEDEWIRRELGALLARILKEEDVVRSGKDALWGMVGLGRSNNANSNANSRDSDAFSETEKENNNFFGLSRTDCWYLLRCWFWRPRNCRSMVWQYNIQHDS